MIAKKNILEVYGELNPETGESFIDWKFGEKVNCYALLGVLEEIKFELLSYMQFNEGEDES